MARKLVVEIPETSPERMAIALHKLALHFHKLPSPMLTMTSDGVIVDQATDSMLASFTFIEDPIPCRVCGTRSAVRDGRCGTCREQLELRTRQGERLCRWPDE